MSQIIFRLVNRSGVVRHGIRRFSAEASLAVKACTDGKAGVVVGIYQKELETEDPHLTPCAEIFNTKNDGKLLDLVRECRLTGELGKFKTFTAVDRDFGSVCVVGLGKQGAGYCEIEALEEGRENVRIAAGIGARQLRDFGCKTIYIDPMEYPEHAAEGSALAIWRYQEHKAPEKRGNIPKLELYESPDTDSWIRGLFKADAQNLARTLCEAPANQLTPTAFAQAAVDALCPCGVCVEVRNQEWIEAQKLNTFLTVAKSSCEPPLFLEINYNGDERGGAPIVLIGPGITFNSGGLCLTSPDEIAEQKAAMSGGASVVATIRAAAALSLPLNIVGVIPMCENMPSGMAYKPGDVITAQDGKTICIEDSSYAARTMLADIFLHCQTNYKPKMIIDVSVMSNDIAKTLGQAATGVFCSSEYLWEQVQKAGAVTGDRVWRLPLWNFFSREVKDYSHVDLCNKGTGQGQACMGAAFLREFVPCIDWMHFDVSATGLKKKTCNLRYLENGLMTGRPTRTIIQLLHQLACPDERLKSLVPVKNF
ncbi:cytosol aminopeptidase-like [Culicoides brevitarsis]|uniref:cytosol aminopeptidase-like n=1 Tax=Culicoides brevitarsis TaxID=469753 RepID=UPI00307CBD90